MIRRRIDWIRDGWTGKKKDKEKGRRIGQGQDKKKGEGWIGWKEGGKGAKENDKDVGFVEKVGKGGEGQDKNGMNK